MPVDMEKLLRLALAPLNCNPSTVSRQFVHKVQLVHDGVKYEKIKIYHRLLKNTQLKELEKVDLV